MAVCWINGSVVPADQARVSVFDHGLLYGDGVFEGIRFYGGQPFRLAQYLDRLQRSARALALEVPYQQWELEGAIEQTIAAFDQPEGYLRLVVTRGEGPLGIDPRSCGRGSVFIIADQLKVVSDQVQRQGARLVIASVRRLGPDGIDPRIKSLNYLNPILARLEANRAGADEAVLLNSRGYVAEGSVENIFTVAAGVVRTPPVSDGALEGITRGVVLELARRVAIPCREERLTPYDLYTADECFLCGTGAQLLPVAEVEGRPMGCVGGPVFSRLQQAFADLVAEEVGAAAPVG